MFKTEIIFALMLGITILARYLWMRFVNRSTRLPKAALVWEEKLSRYAHLGIYLGVTAIVLSRLSIALGFAVPALSSFFLSVMDWTL